MIWAQTMKVPTAVPGYVALPIATTALLLIGTSEVLANGGIPRVAVLALSAVTVGIVGVFAQPGAAVIVAVTGFFVAVSFLRRPYGTIKLAGSYPSWALLTLLATTCLALVAGRLIRHPESARRATLVDVSELSPSDIRRGRLAALARAVDVRRQLLAAALAIVGLPALTALLSLGRGHLRFDDDLLIYLVAVVAITIVGGFWPAVLAAVIASLLANWYFTRPFHTLTIQEPANLLALLLFLTVAVIVSSVVHLSARRAELAARTSAAAEVLAEGNRMRTALLAAVSHDLRTPLSSIKAAASSLRQGDITWSPEDEAELLATIEESADRLDELIGNLLDMSRLATGSLRPYLRPTSVEEIAPVALRMLEGGSSVQFVIPDELPLVETDPGLLERALANLVSNALRYSPSGSPPTLQATSVNGHVRISVVDHGPGVPQSLVPAMFEPFQRLGDTDTSTGVGLGLAVAKGFVEVLGGAIDAQPTAGGGLTMTIDLPTARRG